MLEIKTIKKRLADADVFDREVNIALREGWQLTKREVLHPGNEFVCFSLYAELERQVVTKNERNCGNCLYCDQDGGDPCNTCDVNTNDAWEPGKGVVAV